MKRSKKTKANNARDLSFYINDRTELARRVFLALKPTEVKAMAPKFAKTLPMEKIQALCRDELFNMSAKSLRSILSTPPPETIVLDSDSEAEDASASSLESGSSDTDTSDSDGSDDTEKSSGVSEDVMVIEDDSNGEDIKVNMDNKQEIVVLDASRKNSNTDRANEDIMVKTQIGNSKEVVTDQYVDGIRKLDMLSAKLGQEIEKLSKKEETASCGLTNEYVNEMLHELTRIESEISTEQTERREESAEQMYTNKIEVTKRRAKRKGIAGESKSPTNTKQSKIAKSALKNYQATQQSEDAILGKSDTAHNDTSINKRKEIRKPEEDTTTVNRLTDLVTKKDTEENIVQATVCLLSDSDDSQDQLDSELQQSITESRKYKVLKERKKEKPKVVHMSAESSITLDKRKKPFSEQDIEIEIVVCGGPNLENKETPQRDSRKVNLQKTRKHTNVDKGVSKNSSESIVNDIIHKIDSTRSKQLHKNNPDSGSSSDGNDSDKNSSGPEEGEIDLLSDNSESAEDKIMSKKRVYKKRALRITSKNVADVRTQHNENNNHNKVVDTSVAVNSIGTNPVDDELIERNNESVRPQLRSTIIKVTDSDRRTQVNTNALKSVVGKLPQVNENIINIKVGDTNIKTRVLSNETNVRPKEIDNITVVVKNDLDDETKNTDRVVKMTQDIKSVESVVVAVTNKVNGDGIIHDPNNVCKERQDPNKNIKAKDVLKPVEQKCVAKAADFVFVKTKDRKKPMLMARNTNEKTAKPHENIQKPSTLDNEQDMDIIDIDYVELMNDAINTAEPANSDIDMTEQNIVEPDDEETLRTNSEKINANAENVKDALEQNAETSIDNLKRSDAIEKIINCVEPGIGIVSKTLGMTVTNYETISYNIEKESKQTALHQTVLRSVEPVTFEVKGSDLNNRESVYATETLKIVENTERIDCVRNVTNIHCTTVENTSLKNAVVNAEEMEHFSEETVENKLESLNFSVEAANSIESSTAEVENETRIKSVTEVDPNLTMNLELVTGHSQLDIMPSTEANSLDSENQALQQDKIETVQAIPELDTALEISATEATVLDQANQSLEEGELDPTAERYSPHLANPALEDGEIDFETEIASKSLEDGELTVPSSSDVESVEIPEEIICISDEEPGQNTGNGEPATGKLKKKKNKDKKNKKEEKMRKTCKCKRKQNKDMSAAKLSDKSNVDYLEICSKDPNDILFECHNSNSTQEDKNDIVIDTSDEHDTKHLDASRNVTTDSSDIEITENAEATSSTKLLNDTKDSSQNVIDILSIEISSDEFSDEPLFEDLDDLTAAIDGIERQQEAEQSDSEGVGDIENMSWRDRYLDSKKVKKVLTTSNILNALRKKNKELKKKLLESKEDGLREVTPEPTHAEEITQTNIEEGSIEHYNTLQGSTKFVDPIADKPTETPAEETAQNVTDTQIGLGEVNEENAVLLTDLGNPQGKITKEMKKDAKNLLKMYKKLLKYNDMSRNKKAKKKRNKDGTG